MQFNNILQACRISPHKGAVIVLSVLMAASVYALVLPQGEESARAIAVTVLAACLWISEVIPLALTAVFIPVLLMALGVLEPQEALGSFGSPVLFLILGGYALATAVHVHHIDKWITWTILKKAGTGSFQVIFSLMLTSAVLSMLISNTATTALLLPVAADILKNQKEDPNLARLMLLGIAYGASMGGIATLIGSPPNAIAAGLLDISFLQWLGYGLPVSVVMLAVSMPILWRVYRPGHKKIEIEHEEHKPVSPAGKRTLAIVAFTIFMWLFGPALETALGMPEKSLGAANTAILAIALMLITRTLDIKAMAFAVRWDVMLLLAGGLTLGVGLTESGAADWLAGLLVACIGDLPVFAILAILVTIAVFATELISNTAVTAKMAPILMGVALKLGIESSSLVVPVAIATSMAFMLPVATPPNAMVHASGHVSQKDMIRSGILLNLAAVIVITLIFSLY